MSQRPIRKIFLQWYRFLPYHLARIGAARQLLGTDGITVEGLETASQDEIYKQNDIADATIFPRHTIFEGRSFHTIPVPEIRDGVLQTLDRLQPDAIAINGYGIADGRACLLWCRRNHRPAILMSESWEGDAKRSWPREWLKSLIVRQFSAALVGGNRHQSYIESLGIPRERVFTGYDAVNNDMFAAVGADVHRREAELRQELKLPRKFFLSSGRFVTAKNFEMLLRAYAKYRATVSGEAWDLVLIGDGELAPRLREIAEEPQLKGHVILPGFLPYDRVPLYYGLASVYVHPSIVEPWGLVVNEAMASGLPVLVSERCGCAPDLVNQGGNGFTFDPSSTDDLAKLFGRVSDGSSDLAAMGRMSQERIANFSPAAFSSGLRSALLAAQQGPTSGSVLADLLLRLSLRG